MNFKFLEKNNIDPTELYKRIYVLYLLIDVASSLNSEIVYELKSLHKSRMHIDEMKRLERMKHDSDFLIKNVDSSFKTFGQEKNSIDFGNLSDSLYDDLDREFSDKIVSFINKSFFNKD